MFLLPGEVVMVVDFFHDVRPQNSAHDMARDGFAAGVSVAARQRHGGDIIVPERRGVRNYRGRNVHSILASSLFQKMRRRLVTESARTEVHADPDPVRFIGENIDIMISAADGAELSGRALFQIAHRLQTPRRIFKQFVIDSRFAGPADTE